MGRRDLESAPPSKQNWSLGPASTPVGGADNLDRLPHQRSVPVKRGTPTVVLRRRCSRGTWSTTSKNVFFTTTWASLDSSPSLSPKRKRACTPLPCVSEALELQQHAAGRSGTMLSQNFSQKDRPVGRAAEPLETPPDATSSISSSSPMPP